MQVLAPNLSEIELLLDHVHRIPKPPFLPDTTMCDVLASVYFFRAKEAVLLAGKNTQIFPEPFEAV